MFTMTHRGTWALGPFTSTADVPGRRALRSAGTNRLCLRLDWLQSVADLFRLPPFKSGTLPEHIVSAPALQSFRRHVKTFLLQQSFCLEHC